MRYDEKVIQIAQYFGSGPFLHHAHNTLRYAMERANTLTGTHHQTCVVEIGEFVIVAKLEFQS